jgi:DNA-nicking Smr family endonuclease
MTNATDTELWHAFTQNVTPLTQRQLAMQPIAAPPLQRRQVDHTLDLHGLTLAEAHAQTFAFLAATRHHYRYVTIVTGVSGPIRYEFLHWIDRHPDVRHCESLPGDGSFRLYYRKFPD